ncbi:hypothetical protein [Sulfitobacter sp. TBRI5]|uniref:hypothetical protein n=1 Tax=Sulfitobacter sp. TBRI5 TaxID=2989732 RepID=UPI003D9ABB6F
MQVIGFKREIYKSANAIRKVVEDAFIDAGLPTFTPHSFRKTLVKWAYNRSVAAKIIIAVVQSTAEPQISNRTFAADASNNSVADEPAL